MPEQLLDGADVVAVLEHVGCEGVEERVESHALRDLGLEAGGSDEGNEDLD